MKIDKKVIVVTILLMVIGFASITTTLVLSGTIQIGFNAETFDKNVIFTRSVTDEEGISTISEDGKTITFTSKTLSKVNDIANLEFDITNKNTEYDANVSINCMLVSNVYQEYLNIESSKNNYELIALEKVTDNLKITLEKAYIGEEEIEATFTCNLEARPKSRSKRETTTTTKPVEYKEALIKGAEPKITGDLIPVTIASTGTVTYADVYQKWYSYANKEWANAVILKSNPSKNYKVGNTILESDIDAYFVWIPKYKYKLWNVGTTEENKGKHSIEIEFDTEDTNDEVGVSCATPLTSGSTGSCANGLYMTHPAFITMEVNGFWVGKFETGYRGATSTKEAEQNNATSTNIIIKPNVYSWRNVTVANIFAGAYNYKRNLNSHMMKNTEWGAVAYLSHSMYGINTEVRINNNSDFKTGYASVMSQPQYPGIYGDGGAYNNPYNTSVGYLASTTGNITGIYDMSGGAHEYMAAYSAASLGSSGLTATAITNYGEKYFDVYNANSTEATYQYRILGDATGEMGPFSTYADSDGINRHHNSWYADLSDFVGASYPWIDRGGCYINGALTGSHYFSRHMGAVYNHIGSRIVLSVK